MCTLQMSMQCYNRFFEIALDEREKAELFVEEMVGHVLLDLFGEGIVDDVTISCSSGLPLGLHYCSISICAQCSCEGFVLFPRTQEHMRRAIERSISSILKELFVTVKFDSILLRPSKRECKHNTEFSYSVPRQLM